MPDPTVVAVMLTADRPELARRAVECFRQQTYQEKQLLIYDTGTDDAEDCPGDYPLVIWIPEESRGPHNRRNCAKPRTLTSEGVEVDLSAGHLEGLRWGHPDPLGPPTTFPIRIASSPNRSHLLQSSPGAECVGYREMLFWREGRRLALSEIPGSALNDGCTDGFEPGEAWLYTNPDPRYALGTSLCYWRKTWERKPFEALPTSAPDSASEDARFIAGLNCVGESAFRGQPWETVICACGNRYPRSGSPCAKCNEYPLDGPLCMIARIHAGNTSQAYDPRNMERSNKIKGGPWRRVPEWDAYARSVMG